MKGRWVVVVDLEGDEVEVSQEAMGAAAVEEEEAAVAEEVEEEDNKEPETGSVQTRKSGFVDLLIWMETCCTATVFLLLFYTIIKTRPFIKCLHTLCS